jgi:hypothetical protein
LFLREAADLFIGGGFAIAFSLTFPFFKPSARYGTGWIANSSIDRLKGGPIV